MRYSTRRKPATPVSSSTTCPTGTATGNTRSSPCSPRSSTHATATALAGAYRHRWEHEIGNRQLKTYLRGPGKVLRSKHPDIVYQEIYGYLLTHHAISALTCQAATAAGIDPDRIKFKRAVRIIRDRVVTDPAFSP